MRSTAQFMGHPIHPMLVSFPIAFIVGGFGFDLASKLGGGPSLCATGAYLGLAAVGSGILAAVPGIIDYYSTVPPRSSAKSRATKHGLINGSALLVFTLGWMFRDSTTLEPGWGTLALEGGAALLITWGGWLGGVLVFRNQIGVDHRYAQAGTWKEQTVEGAPGEWAVVARADELQVSQMKLLHLRGHRLVLARTEEGYVAFEDRCTHRGGSLAGGVMAGCVATCPWHGSQFDARTGAVISGPAEQPIAHYTVKQIGDEVRLRIQT